MKGWKTKRAIGTALWSLAPYLVWTYIVLDPTAAFSDAISRAYLLVATAFVGGMAFTYPGWRWDQ